MVMTKSTVSPQSVREAFDLWSDASISKDSNATTKTESTIQSSYSASSCKPENCRSQHLGCMKVGKSKSDVRSVKQVLFSPSDDVVEIEHVDDIPDEQHEAVWWTKDEFKQLKKEYNSVVKKVEAGKKVKNDSFRGLESRIVECGTIMYAVICRAKDAVFEEQDLQVMSGSFDPNELRAAYLMASRSARVAALENAKKDHEAVRDYLQDVIKYWEQGNQDAISEAGSLHSGIAHRGNNALSSAQGNGQEGTRATAEGAREKNFQSLSSENLEILQRNLKQVPDAKATKDSSSSSRKRSSSVGKRSVRRDSNAAWMGMIGDDGKMIAETATTIALRSPKKGVSRRCSLDSSMPGKSQQCAEQDATFKSPRKGSSRRQSMGSGLTGLQTDDAVCTMGQSPNTPTSRKGLHRRRSLENALLHVKDEDATQTEEASTIPVVRSPRKGVSRRRSLDSSVCRGDNVEEYASPIKRSPRKGVSRRRSLDSSSTSRNLTESSGSDSDSGQPRVIIRSPRRRPCASVMSQGTYSAPRSVKVQQGVSDKGIQFAEMVRKASRRNSVDACSNLSTSDDAESLGKQKRQSRRHSLEVSASPKESNDMLSYVIPNQSPDERDYANVANLEEESVVRRCTRRSSVDLYREHSLRGSRTSNSNEESKKETKPKRNSKGHKSCTQRSSIDEPPSMFSQELVVNEEDLEWPSWPENGGDSFDTDSLEGSPDESATKKEGSVDYEYDYDYEYEPPSSPGLNKQASDDFSGDDEDVKTPKPIPCSCKISSVKKITSRSSGGTNPPETIGEKEAQTAYSGKKASTKSPKVAAKKSIKFVKGLMIRLSRGGRSHIEN